MSWKPYHFSSFFISANNRSEAKIHFIYRNLIYKLDIFLTQTVFFIASI